MDSELTSMITWLNSISVRFRPNSIEVYDAVLDLARKFERLPADEKTQFSAIITDDVSKKLLAFSGFFSEIALKTKNPKWIRGALVLHQIEGVKQDCRENIRYLYLIDYAANCIGISLKEQFLQISRSPRSRSDQCIKDYISSSRDPRDIESLGLRIECIDGSPRFIPIE